MGKRGPLAPGQTRTKASVAVISVTYFPAERGMGDDAKKIWRSVVRSMPEDYFVESDRAQLRGYCEAFVMMANAASQLQERGEVYTDHNGNPKESPWVGIYNKSLAMVNSTATKLKISKSTQVTPKNAGRAALEAKNTRITSKGSKIANLLMH